MVEAIQERKKRARSNRRARRRSRSAAKQVMSGKLRLNENEMITLRQMMEVVNMAEEQKRQRPPIRSSGHIEGAQAAAQQEENKVEFMGEGPAQS